MCGPCAMGLGGGDPCACPVLHSASQPLPSPPARARHCALTAMFPGCLLSGVCLSTLGLCAQLAASWPVCGCGVCGVGAPAPSLIPPASLPYGALGVLAPRALSGLSLMCCLGSWGGKVRRRGLLSPRPGRFGRLQVDGVSFAGLRDRETQ